MRRSFYAGANSLVRKKMVSCFSSSSTSLKGGEKIAKEAEERKRLEMMEGWLRCAWCYAWNK